MPLLARVRAALGRLLPTSPQSPTRLVAAVSGGADSLCMLHLLDRLRGELGLDMHVAHLDHRLRAAQSAADARFVADTAARLGLPYHLGERDVAAYARAQGLGIQAAARELRYAFLAELGQQIGAGVLAVAHTADDQAETVLMHLLRGAGPAGLRGMQPALPWHAGLTLIRPLLEIRRAEVEAYCAAHGLEPRHDPSNDSPKYLRGRLRHDLLPRLAAYNPQIVEALARTARICGEDYAFLQQELDRHWPGLVRASADALRLDHARLLALHPALRRYALRRAVELLLGAGRALDLLQIEAAEAALLAGVGSGLELAAGLRLDVVHGSVVLSRGKLRPPADALQLAAESLSLPAVGTLALGAGWSLRVGAAPLAQATGRWAVRLDRARLVGPLVVRRRRPGDHMRPVGGQGSRRLQDLFVDHKVPRELREAWPILASGEAIVWVPGIGAAAGYEATEMAHDIVYIELRQATPDEREGVA
jgi:tRNA(Ile)-lysidine synthetase-like protein